MDLYFKKQSKWIDLLAILMLTIETFFHGLPFANWQWSSSMNEQRSLWLRMFMNVFDLGFFTDPRESSQTLLPRNVLDDGI